MTPPRIIPTISTTATDSFSKVLFEIQQLQQIQMMHPSNSRAWLDASQRLQPLFARMAEITRGGK